MVLIFIFQLGYLSYKIPQLILLDFDVTKEIKLSAVVAGITVGILFFTKKKNNDLNKPEDPLND